MRRTRFKKTWQNNTIVNGTIHIFFQSPKCWRVEDSTKIVGNEQNVQPTIGEIFAQQFILALESGMSYKEFWEEDPEIFWAYHFYFYEKQKLDTERTNVSAWLNGLYVYNAVSVSLSNAFKKAGEKADTYIGQPIDLQLDKLDNTAIEEKSVPVTNALEISIKQRAKQIKEILEKRRDINNGQK